VSDLTLDGAAAQVESVVPPWRTQKHELQTVVHCPSFNRQGESSHVWGHTSAGDSLFSE
jgi:hypothetical protein